ncbi:MAG: energy-coupling factor transporter ATPase [Clostridiales bacterium]|nr:energy-coupling factor transporter ATPase [Clostridiales bacterium]
MTVLEARNISYKYSVGTPFEMTALNNINLKVEKGEMLAIIGHTGSGKSTLIQHFNALLKPSEGQILLYGKDINESKETAHAARFKVGLCFQYPEYQLFEDTVYKDIAFGPGNMGLDKTEIDMRVRRAASFVGLNENMLQKSPFDLSGGEKRRAAIAGVMAMEPEVLIMDEPAAGLDPKGRRVILDLIKNYRRQTGSTVIIVSHSMEDVAEIAEKIAVLNHGELAMYGTVDRVFERSSELCDMGLNIPQITRIFTELNKCGFGLNKAVYTVEQAERELTEYLHKGGKSND